MPISLKNTEKTLISYILSKYETNVDDIHYRIVEILKKLIKSANRTLRNQLLLDLREFIKLNKITTLTPTGRWKK